MTEEDLAEVRAAARRTRLASLLAGALGVVAGFLGGIAVSAANSTNTHDNYPYAIPAAGLAKNVHGTSRAWIAISAAVGFVATFLIIASLSATVIMYAVWSRD